MFSLICCCCGFYLLRAWCVVGALSADEFRRLVGPTGEVMFLTPGGGWYGWVWDYSKADSLFENVFGSVRAEFAVFAWLTAGVRVCWCAHCDLLGLEGDFATVQSGELVCDGCVGELYVRCAQCICIVHKDSVEVVAGHNKVCLGCVADLYDWCEHCDVYDHKENRTAHNHTTGYCNCESPQPLFTTPNNDGTLPNDTRVTITLPGGEISAAGTTALRDYLITCCGPGVTTIAIQTIETCPKWVTTRGTYPKRLSTTVYTQLGRKLPPQTMSRIGNIFRDHTTKNSEYHVETTRQLNGDPEDFYHTESCWWSEKTGAPRCALKQHGGFAIRAFDDEIGGIVVGRAWAMPLKQTNNKLTPTFDTETPDALVVFNPYGNLHRYTAARLISHMTGQPHRKIRFQADPMSINQHVGYLIAPEHTLNTHHNIQLTLTTH